MSTSWTFQDKEFARTVLHVLIEDEPTAPPVPAEWDTDNGLGWFVGMKNAMPFLILFYVCVGIVGWLIFKQ